MAQKVTLPTVYWFSGSAGWFKCKVTKTITINEAEGMTRRWGYNEFAKPGREAWVGKCGAEDGSFFVCDDGNVFRLTKEAAASHLKSVLDKNHNYVLLTGDKGPAVWERYAWEMNR